MWKQLVKWGVVGAVVTASLAGGLLTWNHWRLPTIPVPEAAIDPTVTTGPLAFSRQVTFEVKETYPGHSVRDFYADWAQEHGWQRVLSDEEAWSVDEWQTFEDATRGSVRTIHQWLVHWASPERKWSLRLALRYNLHEGASSKGVQTVTVILQPFQLLG